MSDISEESQENLLKWVIRYVLIPVSLAVITGLFAIAVIDREIASRRQQPDEDFASIIFATMTAVAGQNQPEASATPVPSSTPTLAPTATEEAQVEETPVVEADTSNKPNPGNTAVCGLVPAGWRLYTVQPGNTLYSLARQSGTTITAIQQANCLYGQLMAYTQIWLPPLYLDDMISVTKAPTITITPTVLLRLPELTNATGELPAIAQNCDGSVCATTVTLAVTNQGSADVGSFDVLVRIDPEQSIVMTDLVEGLAVGDTAVLSLTSPPTISCYDPDCSVCISVDSRGAVLEENEGNNLYCTTFISPVGGG